MVLPFPRRCPALGRCADPPPPRGGTLRRSGLDGRHRHVATEAAARAAGGDLLLHRHREAVLGGVAWMNGYTLQNYIFSDAVPRDFRWGSGWRRATRSASSWPCSRSCSRCSSSCRCSLPRPAPLFFLGGICFHIGLYATSGHPFFQHIVMNALLLLFLDPSWFPARLTALRALTRARAPPAEAARPFWASRAAASPRPTCTRRAAASPARRRPPCPGPGPSARRCWRTSRSGAPR